MKTDFLTSAALPPAAGDPRARATFFRKALIVAATAALAVVVARDWNAPPEELGEPSQLQDQAQLEVNGRSNGAETLTAPSEQSVAEGPDEAEFSALLAEKAAAMSAYGAVAHERLAALNARYDNVAKAGGEPSYELARQRTLAEESLIDFDMTRAQAWESVKPTVEYRLKEYERSLDARPSPASSAAAH
jgi:hypothetical protein